MNGFDNDKKDKNKSYRFKIFIPNYARAHILRYISFEVKRRDTGVAWVKRRRKIHHHENNHGLVTPKNGAILFKDKAITNKPNHFIARQGLCYVPGEHRIFSKLAVLENLQIGEKPANQDSLGQNNDLWTLDQAFGLFPKLFELKDRLGRHLSVGE